MTRRLGWVHGSIVWTDSSVRADSLLILLRVLLVLLPQLPTLSLRLQILLVSLSNPLSQILVLLSLP